MKSALTIVVAFAFILALPLGAANAQVMSREAIALRNQILEVQHQLEQLQRQVEANGKRGSALGGSYRTPAPAGNSGTSDLVANLLQQVDSLQDQVRNLRGKVDELTNSTSQKIADLGKKISDLKFQFELAQGKGALPAGTAPGAAPTSSKAAPPAAARPSAGVLLRQSQAALAQADYPTAIETAGEIVRTDAHSPMAYEAQFVLARALFGEKQYTKAALAYDDVYGRDPGGLHAQDSLLGLARSLALINQTQAACAALTKLHKQFPTLRPDVRTGAARLTREARCG